MLKAEFDIWYSELHVHAKEICLFQNPFADDIDEALLSYQFELGELQYRTVMFWKAHLSPLVSFNSMLPSLTRHTQPSKGMQ